uniref:Transmembrane protein 18 n=1 Tax=Aegilops tauschii TaxID=37682 RepID=M8BP75_AEGTA
MAASSSSPAAAAVGRAVEEEPWLIGMISFHVILLLVTIISRRNINFQLILSALTFSGVFLAEKINTFLGQNWKSFSSQNYFDPQGLFISVMWSGPLLLITILILVNTLVTLCMLMVRWKRAELKHRAREARSKQE